jgi:hypothetical protein
MSLSAGCNNKLGDLLGKVYANTYINILLFCAELGHSNLVTMENFQASIAVDMVTFT